MQEGRSLDVKGGLSSIQGEALFGIKEVKGVKEVRVNSKIAKALRFYFLLFLLSQESSFTFLIPGFPS